MTQHSDNANDSPTSCSTECFSCVAGELVPRTTEVLPVVEFRDVPKHVEPLPVAMLATASKHSSIFIADRVVGGAVQQRYLTSLVPAYLMDVVLLGSASEVSEGMTSQSTIASSTWVDVQIVQRVQFLPVSRSLETTHLFDTASFLLWPSVCSPSPTEFQRTISEHPMLILVGLGSFLKFPSSYMRPRALETIRSWNTLWPPFSLGWFVILLRQPWPPPIPVEMLVCSADSFLKLQADWFSEWKLPWVSLVCINNISCCSRRVFLLLDGKFQRKVQILATAVPGSMFSVSVGHYSNILFGLWYCSQYIGFVKARQLLVSSWNCKIIFSASSYQYSVSCTRSIYSWKPSCVFLMCLYRSNGYPVSSTNIWPNVLVIFMWWRKFRMSDGDSKLRPSNCAMLWLHEYCDYEPLSVSAQFKSGNIRLLDAQSVHNSLSWNQVSQFSGHLLLVASFMVTEIQIVPYLQAPSPLLWLCYTPWDPGGNYQAGSNLQSYE